jgi:hypothetical protein
MSDVGVGAREELADLAAVLPAHAVRGCTVLAKDLEYLAVSVRLTEMVTANDELIAR